MSRICLITDTHMGIRGNSPYFLENQKKFFEEVFFPYLDDNPDIKTVVHLGDVFDKRPTVNFVILDEAIKCLFNPLKERGLTTHVIIGNHDTPFRNSNSLNAPQLLLTLGYDFNVYSGPTEVEIEGNKLCFVPWINDENRTESIDLIEKTESKYLLGHLEISGFQMQKGVTQKEGLSRSIFDKFTYTLSGHFHHRSTEGRIYYLGSPYEMTWADFENKKGFHILDFDTNNLEFIENPNTVFEYVDEFDNIKEETLAGKMVKINLTSFTSEEIEKTYSAIDKFKIRPQNILFINNKFVQSNTAIVDTKGEIQTTPKLIETYVKSINGDDTLTKYVTGIYEKALQL